jgi:ABC-type branched-subunit amino acid transport system ATPase component
MLRAEGIAVAFGAVRAVDGVDLTVGAAEAVGIVGPNGSGKSTLLNAITGVVRASGSLAVEGERVPLGRPGRVRRAGVARSFQTPQTFAELTCIENVLLGDADRRATGLAGAWLGRPGMLRRERARWARAVATLERVGLADRAEDEAGLLSYGQQRMLELARALVGSPRVLLADEPSAGLNAAETDTLARLLADLHGSGLTLLVVDHKIDFIEAVSTRVVVLQLGRVIADGEPDEVWRNPEVVDAYLGRSKAGV